MAKNLGEAREELKDLVNAKNPLLSDLMEDIRFLEKTQKKKKEARFIKGVSLSEQKRRVNNVLKAGLQIINIGKKVRKSLEAKEKRIWGDMQWMNDDDKAMSDQVYAEKNKLKKERLKKKEEMKEATE